ncbi:MAG: hypothetical protein G01um101425_843 [Candidatus Peregrinibacteria bacterium Gr01-1014_25]|nr:MAG: hypothetical protein G01um101425_843 [Candidatus Peregrinibacteria bacterium Gr01-1014_25]
MAMSRLCGREGRLLKQQLTPQEVADLEAVIQQPTFNALAPQQRVNAVRTAINQILQRRPAQPNQPAQPNAPAGGNNAAANVVPPVAAAFMPGGNAPAPEKTHSLPRALTIGASTAAVPAAAALAATAWSPTFLGLTTGPMIGAGATLGFPAAVGAGAGYWLGKKVGHPVAGTAAGFAAGTVGGYAILSQIPALAGLGLSVSALPVAGAIAAPAIGAAGAYGLGRVHRWAWDTPHDVGTWGTLGRGVLAPATLLAGRPLNWLHEKAWSANKSTHRGTQLLRTLIAPASVPTGIVWNRAGVGAMLGGLWRGFGFDYKPKHESGWKSYTEALGSIPGRIIRWPFSAIAKVPGKVKSAWHYLFDKTGGASSSAPSH